MKKKLLILLVFSQNLMYSSAINYNGNPNRSGGITITPQTSSAVLASYTQTINIAGLLDKTFAGIGYTTKNISGVDDRGQGVVIQPDGKIIVVGVTNANFTQHGGGDPQTGFYVTMRYNTDGSLDTSFGPNKTGIIQTSFSGVGWIDGASSVALQSDGKIVVVGQTKVNGSGTDTGFIGIIRYNSDGSTDNAFGTNGNGTVTKNLSGHLDAGSCVLMQPDGKILVGGVTNITGAGDGTGNIVILRYNSDGSPDSTFGPGSNGYATLNPSGTGFVDAGYALALQPDGKIIVVGGTNINNGGGTGNIIVLRYTANGYLDNSFGQNANGIVQTNISGRVDNGYGVALQPNGSIVAVGAINIFSAAQGFTGTGSIVVLRYTSNGILDASFGSNNSGYTTLHLSDIEQLDVALGVVLQKDGKIIVVGGTNYDNNIADRPVGNIFTLRYNVNGTLDATFGPNNTGIIQLNISAYADNATAVSMQSDGKIVVAGLTNFGAGVFGTPTAPLEGYFALIRYSNPFTLSSFTASYGGVGLL